MKIPLTIDIDRNGNLVQSAELFQPGYGENLIAFLSIYPQQDGVHIEYKSEDDQLLDEKEVFFFLMKINELNNADQKK
jgi:hypothetical protein